MKCRMILLIVSFLVGICILSGCGKSETTPQSDNSSEIEEKEPEVNVEILEGITMNVIGDSYFAGKGLQSKDDVWPSLLAREHHMEFRNYGMNGSTISNFAGTNFNPMVDRFGSMANNNPNIIIVEGGRNDYCQNVPMGENDSIDPSTMKGAVRYLLSGLQEKYPNALIIGVTCWEVGGLPNEVGYSCSDYGNAFIEVCESMNIPCINAMDVEAIGVDMRDAAFRRQYCISHDDISHLNEEGMKLVLPVFEKEIAKYYEEFLENR